MTESGWIDSPLRLTTESKGGTMSAAGEVLISIAGIERVFYTDEVETHALSGIDLEIRPGEYVSIEGPSGSGKSTLLSIIGLLDSPTQAQDGREPGSFSARHGP